MVELITLGQARLFRDIVDRKSVSKAAQENGISQSAASQHLNELERRLDATLLDRSTRPFTIKAAGKLYYELCRDIVRRADQFEASLTQLKAEVGGTVRVASIYSVLNELARIQEDFKRRFPRSRMVLEFLRPDQVYEAVLTGRADLGILSYPNHRRHVHAISWREEFMQVAVPPAHRFAQLESIEPQMLSGEPFVAFDEDIPIRREIDRFLRDQNVEVEIVLHFDSIQMVKEAVELGRGISILPAPAMRSEVAQRRLIAVPLSVKLYRPLALIHDRRKQFSPAVQQCIDLMLSSVEETEDGLIRRPDDAPTPVGAEP